MADKPGRAKENIVNITQIRYFLELAKKLNFCNAAASLFISQPALSRQISSLENELHIQLFERNTKHVSLTKAGKSLYEDLSAIMTELDFALKKAKVLHEGEKKNIRIGIFDTPLINDFWPDIYRSLTNYCPALEIEVIRENFTELFNNFIDGLYDLILTLDHTCLNEKFPFCFKRLLYRKYAIIYSVNSEFNQIEDLQFKDFDNKNVYIVNNKGNIQRVLAELASVGIMKPKVQKVDSTLTLLAYLESGKGFALIDENMVQYNNCLRAFSKNNCFSGTYVTAVWKKEMTFIHEIISCYDK